LVASRRVGQKLCNWRLINVALAYSTIFGSSFSASAVRRFSGGMKWGPSTSWNRPLAVEMIVKTKREARIAYYEGVKQATLDHIKVTEEGLRNLKDMSSEKIDKLVADIHKRHVKLLKRIDGYIKDESRS
jgi:hypothetical protein